MDIFQINELSNDTMNLSHDKFYDFLETVLNKDLSELFRLQAIRDISSNINHSGSNNRNTKL